MKYFTECKTIEDVKETYRKLAIKLHPDKNNNDCKPFIELKKEYDEMSQKLKNIHRNVKGETYEKENTEDLGLFAEMIDKLVKMQGVTIELIGSWLWLTGNTKEYKEMIKEMNFKWCNNKKAWCFHNDEYKKRSKKKFTLEEIRNNYGSRKFENEKVMALA